MRKFIQLNILIFLFLQICLKLYSQNSYQLKVVVKEQDKAVLRKYSLKKDFADTIILNTELKKLLFTLWNDGYISASFDSIVKDSLNISAYLYIGNKYLWINLRKGNAEDILLQEAGYKKKIFSAKSVDFRKIVRLNQNILEYCENNGYPFASVKLDSVIFSDSSVSASINLTKNTKIEIDSIIMKGKAKLAKIYLNNYLSIKPASLYDESKIANISKRLNEITFLKEVKPFNVVFNENKAKIVIYADKKKNSQFDGILGIMPNSEASNKLTITGEVNLMLINSFYRGEIFDISWRKLQQNTQDLKMSFMYPYFLNTPFGTDIKFKLYKNDTLYINIERNAGLRYIFTGNNYLKAFFENHTSSLISTAAYKYASTLPAYADIKINMYGLEYKMKNLDYIFNPRRGYDVLLTASAGNKHIIKNPDLNEKLYEGVKLNSAQYRLSGILSLYIPLFTKAAIKLEEQTSVINNENMFENELFKIGGLKTLRGFDEESITASYYNIITLEYRFLFEQNSFLFAFCNGAYYESRTVNKFTHDTPYGFGAGICFETKAGIFSLSYALGKQFDNPIYLRSAKIHFGLVNYF